MLGDSIKGLRFPSTRREGPGKTTKVFLKKTTTSQPPVKKCMEMLQATKIWHFYAFFPYQQQQNILCDAQ